MYIHTYVRTYARTHTHIYLYHMRAKSLLFSLQFICVRHTEPWSIHGTDFDGPLGQKFTYTCYIALTFVSPWSIKIG